MILTEKKSLERFTKKNCKKKQKIKNGLQLKESSGKEVINYMLH